MQTIEKINLMASENQKLKKSFSRVKLYLNVRYEQPYVMNDYQKAFNDIKDRLLSILEQEEV